MTADYCKRHTYPRTKDYVAAQQIPPSMAWGSQTIKSASIAPVASDVADAPAAAARGMPPSRECRARRQGATRAAVQRRRQCGAAANAAAARDPSQPAA